jgi:glycerol-3-phosphate O-acyltransferase 3/4
MLIPHPNTLHNIECRPCALSCFRGLALSMLLDRGIVFCRNHCKSKALDNTPEFELSDIFYFCRKGMETIMDDEVTKRFSAEELESWNLLSRTNYNFQYISLRLTILWGLGVLIRYCFLLPLR